MCVVVSHHVTLQYQFLTFVLLGKELDVNHFIIIYPNMILNFFTWIAILFFEINCVWFHCILATFMCTKNEIFFFNPCSKYNVKIQNFIKRLINHVSNQNFLIYFLACFACFPSFKIGNLSSLNLTKLSLLIASFK